MNVNLMGFILENLPDKVKYRAYVITIDEYSDVGTHSIALSLNTKTAT